MAMPSDEKAQGLTLLSTKWHMPPVRPARVPRPRLLERLNAASLGQLTLVSAPAGFGKTTLIGEWASVCPHPVAWLSLDEGDNDPARFLAYLTAALGTLDASIEAAPQADGQAGLLEPPKQWMARLINQIGAVGHHLILVMDDVHLIRAQAVQEAMAFLLENLPHNLHLVIATRADPPLPLAALRARAQLTELRQSDLRFSDEEIASFLNAIMQLGLSAEQVTTLADRTEGWVAGLQMAAVSMQGKDRARVDRLVQELAGSDRYIMDYLLSEVLEGQPAPVQAFLMQTSILERLCGPLCDAVVGQRGGAQETLDDLERTNLFVLPLDNRRQWYRYHRLFADLLRSRLAKVQPDRVPQLHQRASMWLEQNGLVAEAIEHALDGLEHERAAGLIERVAEETAKRSELATLLRWVQSLPADLVAARPTLALTHAWALWMTGHWAEAIESYLGEGDSEEVSSKVAPLQALVALLEGRFDDARAMALQALQTLPEGDWLMRGTATWNLSLTRLAEGDFQGAGETLEELVRTSRASGDTVFAVMALCSLGVVHRRQGHLREAESAFERALELATDQDGNRLPAASEPLMALGELWREWNDLDRAAQLLLDGVERAGQWAAASALDGYMSLARLEQARGDFPAADAALERAAHLAEQFDVMEMDDLLVALLQARLLLGRGEIDAARRVIHRWGLDREGGIEQVTSAHALEDGFMRSRLEKYRLLLLARLGIAEGQPAEALALLQPLLLRLEQMERADLMLEGRLLIALAHQALGHEGAALAELGHALALAEPSGYVRVILDEGQPMARLLYQAARRRIHSRYVAELLAGFPVAERPAASEPGPELVEPLSDREVEVLGLVAQGLSNQQIAERLYLSLSTVKWHTHNIYAKLGVRGRTPALVRARALGILPNPPASP